MPDNRLSMAASRIWAHRTFEDPYDAIGRANDCGPLIDAGNRRYELRVLDELGFTPGEYNAELRKRLLNEDGTCSYGVYAMLSMLEIDHVCPECGAGLDVSVRYTRNYGGGWDTFEKCPKCSYAEVSV